MDTIWLTLHSLIRWGVLLFGLLTLVNFLSGSFSNRAYAKKDKISSLLFMTFCDVQLLIGLFLYFKRGWFDMIKSDFKGSMQNGAVRFFTMEHALMMIIAWLLVHIGYSSVKKAGTDKAKFKRGLIFFGLALLIILASIPWPFRAPGVARELFPNY